MSVLIYVPITYAYKSINNTTNLYLFDLDIFDLKKWSTMLCPKWRKKL